MTRSSREPRTGNFIRSQQAGQITNVAGNQRIDGGTYGILGSAGPELADLAEIRRLLDEVPLTRRQAEEAKAAIDQTEAELANPDGKPEVAAGALEDLTSILKAAGALAGAGLALVDPIGRIAVALGSAGIRIVQMLRG